MFITRHRLRTLEALTSIAAALVLVRLLPYRVLRRLVGRVEPGTPDYAAGREPLHPTAAAVGAAVRSAARRLPRVATCLVCAIAAGLMLRRRGTASTLVLGVMMSDGALKAHAWLLAGGGVVCGGRESAEFSPIAALCSGQMH